MIPHAVPDLEFAFAALAGAVALRASTAQT
jgi:hypothetical protein